VPAVTKYPAMSTTIVGSVNGEVNKTAPIVPIVIDKFLTLSQKLGVLEHHLSLSVILLVVFLLIS